MAKNLKKEEANFIYQHYKGQEKLSKFIITKENQRKRCSKNSSKQQKNDFKDKDMTTT